MPETGWELPQGFASRRETMAPRAAGEPGYQLGRERVVLLLRADSCRLPLTVGQALLLMTVLCVVQAPCCLPVLPGSLMS